jgi:hypothetical protein
MDPNPQESYFYESPELLFASGSVYKLEISTVKKNFIVC